MNKQNTYRVDTADSYWGIELDSVYNYIPAGTASHNKSLWNEDDGYATLVAYGYDHATRLGYLVSERNTIALPLGLNFDLRSFDWRLPQECQDMFAERTAPARYWGLYTIYDPDHVSRATHVWHYDLENDRW